VRRRSSGRDCWDGMRAIGKEVDEDRMVGIILTPDIEDAAHCAMAALLDREREVTLPLPDRRPRLRLTIRRDIQASARLFPFGESLTKRLCWPCDRKRRCSDSEAGVDSPNPTSPTGGVGVGE